MMNQYSRTTLTVALMMAMALGGCSDGDDGQNGQDGKDGNNGKPGLDANSYTTTAEAHNHIQFQLEAADLQMKPGAPFSLKFRVTGKNLKGDNVPFSGLDSLAVYTASQIDNPDDIGPDLLWRNPMIAEGKGYYLMCSETGTFHYMGREFDACTLTEDDDQPGSYLGTWEHQGTAPIISDQWDPNALQRVLLRAFNVVNAQGEPLTDKVLSQTFDFVPASGDAAHSLKDSVSSAACQQCHGEDDGIINGLKAHENYQNVENCVLCHNFSIAQTDAINLKGDKDGKVKGWNPDWPAMVHRLHWAQNLTGEAAQNFGRIGYPQKVAECQTCHDNGDSWLTPTVSACEACHPGFKQDTALSFDHSGLNDDLMCDQCHNDGAIKSVHKVGDIDAGKQAVALTLDSVVLDDVNTLTLTYQTQGLFPGLDLGDYYAVKKLGAHHGAELTLTEVKSDGLADLHSHLGVATDGVLVNAEQKLVLTVANAGDWRGKTALIAPHFALCTDGDKLVKHDMDKLANARGYYTPICPDGATISPMQMAVDVVLIGGAPGQQANTLQSANAEQMTVDTAKCNACHDELSLPKMPYGLTDLAQCSQCHNASAAGSYHGSVMDYVTQADGSLKAVETPAQYHNRDLVTVVHRVHSGAGSSMDGEGLFLKEGKLQGYPESQQRCSACHKAESGFFQPNGQLTSGKESMEIEYPAFSGNHYHISPVAESCRGCHTHNTEAALAHFQSNGAVITGDLNTAPLSGAESCAVCHGDGKAQDIKAVHGTRDVLQAHH
ncbi:OmcA/MtrC family decaheme c-type cytochrome [Ferrimonas sp. YFM]|uniref:OmcA/MtrC family decaheme c-type cytochrome n=1 Tax=Ferrimonas sp. YFM TaxID=3028878 RepID=UPI002573BF25|nr:OmcA/MtrC family decaheme c-type cytochrome [Ferrimonas sp. YFM]BDY04450.1 surface localized decaheme cytochrome c lipoprotein [Ferrimonas sp. YFM]